MRDEPITSRAARRKRQRRKRHWWYLPTGILLIAAALGGGYYVYSQQEEVKAQRAEEERKAKVYQQALAVAKEEALTNIPTDGLEEQTAQDGDIDSLLYLDPNDEELNQTLTETAQQAADFSQGLVVGWIDRQDSDKFKKLQPKIVAYQWDEGTEKLNEQPIPAVEGRYVSKKTGKVPTPAEIFPNQQTFAAGFRYLKQALLDSQQLSYEEARQLPAPKLADVETAAFHPEDIQLKLPGFDKAIALDLNTLAPYLEPDFVQAKQPKKVVALTFDDGPNPDTTTQLLKTLEEKQVHATFFMLGRSAEAFPETAKKVADAGHAIANHSYDHPDLATLSAEQVRDQLARTDKILYDATGKLPVAMRPPYGSVVESTVAAIDHPIIHWDVDSEDWASRNVKKIVKQVNDTIDDRSVILLHDIHQESVDSVGELIDSLHKKGYTFTSLEGVYGPLYDKYQYYGGIFETIPYS